mmetsp:Transcript_12238/g.21739  ORF Transcript_12238/g.21739 Transcript_12238/m.21739 type:complete len:884 (+) Transcript_12238:66-2717(+)|eukprot:CAMPEP_0197635264 /NCGR_PEP_ID=MMETSP1338-20131121/11128_1 /TAXON_ID=43686 ORGANISM="Pelagodinium beii, Strain RCC1491" /NCGR_SAMPLE_ID=MMETSP1338 /ASSEMBLY_ACC=CAM_ASM_000754 /LENGTH=883 /DNA_ID=CAMNT_0043207279 /DNA_START=66 /DNA_END=2717 /DNA_ORIENTATION=-
MSSAITCPCFPAVESKAAPKNAKENRVTLNVGGQEFTTVRSTLSTGDAAGSKLVDLIEGPCDEDGVYFLDQDGAIFAHVLNFLRHGAENFTLPESNTVQMALLGQAKMLGIPALVEAVKKSREGDVEKKTEPSQDAVNGGYFGGAALPFNEESRLAKLRSLNVLDTTNVHTIFDHITSACAAILDVPICLVSLVDENRQWFKSRCGLDADETPRSMSFCAFTFKPEELDAARMLIVQDAMGDDRFAKNPLVTGPPFIRFYAGCPLISSEGLRLGSLCAIDRAPKALMPDQAGILINFAYLTAQELERSQLERGSKAVYIDDGPLAWTGGEFRSNVMKEGLDEAVVLVWARPNSMNWRMIYCNKVWTELTGVKVFPPTSLPGHGNVEVSYSCSGSGDMLWDHLRLSTEDTGKVIELWKKVQDIMDSDGPLRAGSSFSATATVRSPAGEGRQSVTCRFLPAELPLNEAAAAVIPAAPANYSKSPKPEGWPKGTWVFVQVKAERSSADRQHNGTATPTSMKDDNLPEMQRRQARAHTEKLRPNPATFPVESQSKQKAEKAIEAKGARHVKQDVPFDDVQLVRIIGQGSFGSVYFSLWNGAAVAVKIITAVGETSQLEASLAASISHPNLVQTYKHKERMTVLDKAEEDTDEAPVNFHETWIVQEWCDGGTLSQHCKEPRLEGKAMADGLEICLEIARAGSYLHNMNIIHGDLTANNVLLKTTSLRKGFLCKVCDFGLARILEGESQEILTKTMGTVTHMPPELFSGSNKCRLTRKADVYALGVILYQVFSAQAPFSGFSAPQIVVYVSQGKRLQLPAEFDNKEIRELSNKLMSVNLEERPSFDQVVTMTCSMSSSMVDKFAVQDWDSEPYRRGRSDPVKPIPRNES